MVTEKTLWEAISMVPKGAVHLAVWKDLVGWSIQYEDFSLSPSVP